MGEPCEQPRRLMSRLDMEICRLSHGLCRWVGVGERKAGEPPGERRLADPFPAPDQPGMRKTALAISRQHFCFGPFVADQRIDMARMGRASERIGFRKIVRLAFFHASLVHARLALSAPAGSSLLLNRRPNGRGDLVLASIGVDDGAAPRLGRGDVEERPPEGLVKGQPL